MATDDQELTLVKGEAIQMELNPDGGEVKSMNSQKMATYPNTNMIINVYCEHEVHGFLDPSEKQPATLLVLQFQLGGKSTTRRFKAFKPQITVHADPRVRERNEPWVTDCIYPGVAMTSFYEMSAKKVEKVDKSLKAALKGPDPSPLEIAAAISKMNQETWTEKYRYTVQATLSEQNPGTRNKDDQILWKAWQQKRVAIGIDVLQVAMVILRKPGYDLQFTIEFEANVDFRYKVKQMWDSYINTKALKKVFKLKVYETVTKEDGSQVQQLRQTKAPDGVDPMNLQKLEGESRAVFQALGWVHTVEAQKPKKYYIGTDVTQLQPKPEDYKEGEQTPEEESDDDDDDDGDGDDDDDAAM